MKKRIVVLQKGIEKKAIPGGGCCANPPVGRAAK